jgi:hypothetical protein
MTDELNDPLMARAQQIERELTDTYGAGTIGQMLGAVGRQGIHPDIIKRVVASPTATADFTRIGVESVLREMENLQPSDPNYKILDDCYTSIRSEQRRNFDFRKGRGSR